MFSQGLFVLEAEGQKQKIVFIPLYSPEVPELALILLRTKLELPMISQTSSTRMAARNPNTQLPMLSVPQMRCRRRPRTRMTKE